MWPRYFGVYPLCNLKRHAKCHSVTNTALNNLRGITRTVVIIHSVFSQISVFKIVYLQRSTFPLSKNSTTGLQQNKDHRRPKRTSELIGQISASVSNLDIIMYVITGRVFFPLDTWIVTRRSQPSHVYPLRVCFIFELLYFLCKRSNVA